MFSDTESPKSSKRNTSLELIHYLGKEGDEKIKRYLKTGETFITDDELQKRRKKYFLDSLFL